MDLTSKDDGRFQKHLKFLLRAYIVSWILAYLGVFRSDTVSAFLAEVLLAGVHKMTAVWILSGMLVVPIVAVYFLYQRAMD